VDDVSLSARELRVLNELEKVLRRQDRLLYGRMRPVGRRAGRDRRGLGRGARALTRVSASLMVLTVRTTGRWTRRAAALGFSTVWLLTRLTAQRNATR
jgi:hypothetical protein